MHFKPSPHEQLLKEIFHFIRQLDLICQSALKQCTKQVIHLYIVSFYIFHFIRQLDLICQSALKQCTKQVIHLYIVSFYIFHFIRQLDLICQSALKQCTKQVIHLYIVSFYICRDLTNAMFFLLLFKKTNRWSLSVNEE